jgi:transcriptional regulator with GAF, ATPase, and Fis domain
MPELSLAAREASPHAGLVLVYSPHYEGMPPAYVLRGEEALVGRDPAAAICVPSGAVSRQHARFHRRDGRWVLTDLGGRNGTLVNGAYVGEVVLEPLDEIRIGDAIFKFVDADAEGYAPYRIDGAVIDPATGEAQIPLAEGRIIGGYQVRRLAAGLRAIAKSALSVMILGESGTGKEVFAQQLHDWSGRPGPFKAVNCAAIPATLLEGELFGHKRGAFSGADRDRVGLVRSAHNGTLFLDEIGDMPLEAQAKLLRVIQTREVTPLGATQPEQVDVRIACATHRDLGKLQQSGAFRGDLFARLNEFTASLPPLRARKEDLYMLCQALAARHGHPDASVTIRFMAGLVHHDFPFNVRELEALIKRWAAVATDEALDVQHFGPEIRESMADYGRARATQDAAPPAPVAGAEPSSAPIPPSAEPVSARSSTAPAIPLPPRGVPEEQQLRALLAEHRGNVAALGRLYGKDRVQVHRWMKRYGINVDDYR